MYVWIDLEMTGLDHRVHRIVEIATVVTDRKLDIVAEGPNLVISATETDLARMPEIVRDMHTKTGLLERILASDVTVAQAEEETRAFIEAHVDDPSKAPLCGNTIGMDRRFLDEYMPKIDKMLHYRSIDVSSFRMVGKERKPDVTQEWLAGRDADPSNVKHRALDDIHASIAELRLYYEKWL